MWINTKDYDEQLKVGDLVRIHNGFDWVECTLDEFNITRGFVLNGLHNETADLYLPSFNRYPQIYIGN